MRGFDNATGSRGKSQRMSDFADMVVWPEKDYKAYRVFGPLFSVCNYWFTIATPRKPEGTGIPKQCLDHDGNTDTMVTEICPFRKSGLGREGKAYYINAIDREEQEGRDYPPIRGRKEFIETLEYEAHWLKAGDSRKTPVRLLEIPDSQIDKIKGFKKLNKVRKRDGTVVGVDISDPRHGCDINILFDPNKKGPARYDVQKGDRKPLTEEELDYGIYRPDLLKPMRLAEAERELEDVASKIVKRDPKGKGKGGSKKNELDDPLMEDSTVRMREDDMEDDRPRRRSSRDEEDEPAPRRSSRGSRSAPDDLDEDFERAPARRSRDDDDEPAPRRRPRRDEDEPAPRRRASRDDDEPAPRRRSRDDDDEPAPRRRAPREEYDDVPF